MKTLRNAKTLSWEIEIFFSKEQAIYMHYFPQCTAIYYNTNTLQDIDIE